MQYGSRFLGLKRNSSLILIHGICYREDIVQTQVTRSIGTFAQSHCSNALLWMFICYITSRKLHSAIYAIYAEHSGWWVLPSSITLHIYCAVGSNPAAPVGGTSVQLQHFRALVHFYWWLIVDTWYIASKGEGYSQVHPLHWLLLICNTNRIHAGESVYATLWKLPALCHVGYAEPAKVAPPLYPTTWMRAQEIFTTKFCITALCKSWKTSITISVKYKCISTA